MIGQNIAALFLLHVEHNVERLAEILINRPSKHLDRTFTYRIPEALSYIREGFRCVVPFSGRTEEGIVLSVRQEAAAGTYRVKDILAAVDEYPWFTAEMLALARWISLYYMCTYIDALRLFLIDKKGIRTSLFYAIDWRAVPEGHELRGLIDESVEELTEEDAKLILGEDVLSSFSERGFLHRIERADAVYHAPLEKWLMPAEGAPEHFRSKQQEALWHFLSGGAKPLRELRAAGFSLSVVQSFCKNELGALYFRPKDTFSLICKTREDTERPLTDEQQKAFDHIAASIERHAYEGILLMGVTGSGKTEVYLRAAEHARTAGGSILILVPEIALTAQMVDYFAARFGDDVVFIHSKLNKTERYNNRMRVANGTSHIVIGSRSALFMPFEELRLIIVDEEYDSSYKQDETPYYNGRDAAKKLALLHRCPVVLGAATPAVVTYAAAEAGHATLLTMKERVHKTPLPKILIVDLKDETAAGNASIYSRELLSQLARETEAGHKAILFLNRRGYATVLMCADCGHVFKCPNCDVSLVYHKERHHLKCHYCESVFPLPERCPACGSVHISYTGRGTERAEEQLEELVPGLSSRRLDLDSTSRKHSSAEILEEFRNGEFSVLLGTQMVTKGHDIPGVQLVGILSADSLLNMPTYLASEQAFTLITQCAGRAGRGEERGLVILQTYDTEHFVIRTASRQDYAAFYAREIEYRRMLRYPPFVKMMKITCFSKEYGEAAARAKKISAWMGETLRHADGSITATPPYDEPIKKVRNTYYISILVKGASLTALKAAMREAPVFRENGILIDVDPLS